MKSFKGKNCLITGATGGIGRVIAKTMHKEGCNLFLLGRSEDRLDKLVKELKTKKKIRTLVYDFNNPKGWFPPCYNIDIVINCIGTYLNKPLTKTSREEIGTSIKVNLLSIINICKMVIPYMKKKKWGRIVNIGSTSAYQGFSNNTMYCATKHAVLGFTRALREELKPYNVRVYCVSPSATKTKMGKLIPNQNYKTFLNPKEIAEYITFVIKYNKELISEEINLNRFKV